MLVGERLTAVADAYCVGRLSYRRTAQNLEAGQPRFSARVTFEGDEMTLEADQPTGQGGGGSRPGPMLYCLYGLASCYAATFATVAAMMGVELKALRFVAGERYLSTALFR